MALAGIGVAMFWAGTAARAETAPPTPAAPAQDLSAPAALESAQSAHTQPQAKLNRPRHTARHIPPHNAPAANGVDPQGAVANANAAHAGQVAGPLPSAFSQSLGAPDSRFHPAPVPDEDQFPPAFTEEAQSSLDPHFFHQRNQQASDGFSRGSSAESDADYQRSPIPGLKLSIPVQ